MYESDAIADMNYLKAPIYHVVKRKNGRIVQDVYKTTNIQRARIYAKLYEADIEEIVEVDQRKVNRRREDD